MRKRKKVYCDGCVYLLLAKRSKVLPLCLAKARFKGGIIRNKIDVIGVVEAATRNSRNNCRFRSTIKGYFRARALKAYLMEDLHAKEVGIEQYPREEEIERKTGKTAPIRPPRRPTEETRNGRERAADSDAVRDIDSNIADEIPSTSDDDRSEGNADERTGDRQARADRGHDNGASDDAGGGERDSSGEGDSDIGRESGTDSETSGGDDSLKVSDEWAEIYSDSFDILQQTGWNNEEVDFYDEPISREQFLRLVLLSECKWKVGKVDLDALFKGIQI